MHVFHTVMKCSLFVPPSSISQIIVFLHVSWPNVMLFSYSNSVNETVVLFNNFSVEIITMRMSRVFLYLLDCEGNFLGV